MCSTSEMATYGHTLQSVGDPKEDSKVLRKRLNWVYSKLQYPQRYRDETVPSKVYKCPWSLILSIQKWKDRW